MTEPTTQPVPVPTPPAQQNSIESLLQGVDAGTKDTLLGIVKDLREENAAARIKLNEYKPIVASVEALQTENASLKQNVEQFKTGQLDAAILGSAKGFNDPTDALAYLTPYKDQYVKEDGSFDADKINAHLGQLLNDKPYLAARRGPAPDVTQASAANDNPAPNTPAEEFAQFFNNTLSH